MTAVAPLERFAGYQALLDAWCAGMGLDPPQLVWEWANENVVLTSEMAAEAGQYDIGRTPYLREILTNLSPSSPVITTILMKGSQIGASQAGLAFILYMIAVGGGPMLVVCPTVGAAEPYEVGARDYANLNYSNARTILLEAWRTFLTKRTWLGQKFYDPVFQTWFEEAVHLGEIPDCTPDDLYAPGMATAWTACRWIGPGKGFIDPLKEAQAQTARMSNGTTSMELECAEQGLDWQENAEQIRAEMDFYDDLKIPYPPALLAKAGIGGAPGGRFGAQPTDADDDTTEKER